MTSSSSSKKLPAFPPPVISPAWIAGFIGHRTGIDEAALAPCLEAELRRLRDEVAKGGGTLHFYSSVADGADLLALDAARRLELPLHVVLPLPEEEFFRPFSSTAARERAKQHLAAIRACPGRHTWRVAPTSMQLPAAYFEADVRIVEAADVLLVVWDGKPEAGLGGTAQLVQLARARRCPIVWIHKDTLEVARENIDTGWPRTDAKLGWLEKKGVARLAADAAGVAPADAAQPLKDNLSKLAGMDARWFRHAIGWVSGLSALAALCGAAGAMLPHNTPDEKIAGIAVCVVEFALLLGVIVFKLRNRRKKVRDEWIDARFGADHYRSLAAGQPLLDPLHPPVASVRPAWRRFALTVGLLLHAAKAPGFDFATFRAGYGRHRLKHQEAYFTKHGAAAKRRTKWSGRIGNVSIALSPVVILLVFFNRAWGLDWNETGWGLVVTGLLPVVLPLIGSVASSLTSLLDHDRRAARYPDLSTRLAALGEELPHYQTEESLRQFVSATEAMLLDELLEWHSVTSRADTN